MKLLVSHDAGSAFILKNFFKNRDSNLHYLSSRPADGYLRRYNKNNRVKRLSFNLKISKICTVNLSSGKIKLLLKKIKNLLH